MIVEHLTLNGQHHILDTKDIPISTVDALKSFQVKAPEFLTQMSYPGTDLSVNVLNYEYYNMFWLFHYNRWISWNLCSYDLTGEKQIYERFGSTALHGGRKPTISQFIYTIPIYWSDLSLAQVPQVEKMTFALYNSFSLAYA